jgi:HAD superfamily phosphatase (TIGR01668 family)
MLFKPTISVENVLSIDKLLLYNLKIKGLILDLDNTLSKDGSPALEMGVGEWLDEMRTLGVKMFIVSNNTTKRVTPLANELGIEFVAFGCKPFTLGIHRAVKAIGLPRHEIAIVGDQIFTDIIGGNLYGIKSILVEPFYLESSKLFRLKRKVEGAMFKREFKKPGAEEL